MSEKSKKTIAENENINETAENQELTVPTELALALARRWPGMGWRSKARRLIIKGLGDDDADDAPADASQPAAFTAGVFDETAHPEAPPVVVEEDDVFKVPYPKPVPVRLSNGAVRQVTVEDVRQVLRDCNLKILKVGNHMGPIRGRFCKILSEHFEDMAPAIDQGYFAMFEDLYTGNRPKLPFCPELRPIMVYLRHEGA